jgi:hypothetical protein
VERRLEPFFLRFPSSSAFAILASSARAQRSFFPDLALDLDEESGNTSVTLSKLAGYRHRPLLLPPESSEVFELLLLARVVGLLRDDDGGL